MNVLFPHYYQVQPKPTTYIQGETPHQSLLRRADHLPGAGMSLQILCGSVYIQLSTDLPDLTVEMRGGR